MKYKTLQLLLLICGSVILLYSANNYADISGSHNHTENTASEQTVMYQVKAEEDKREETNFRKVHGSFEGGIANSFYEQREQVSRLSELAVMNTSLMQHSEMKEDASAPHSVDNMAEDEYADLAIAKVSSYVNVRSEPNKDSSVVGKIYDGAVAHVLGTAGENHDWFDIVSGNVKGYIKAEFFLYGDTAAQVVDDYVTRYANVIADRLNVRETPSTDAKRIGYIDNGEKVRLIEDQGDWMLVEYTAGKNGYVASEYVTLSEEFVYGKTIEEETRELAERVKLEERSLISEKDAAENVSISVEKPAGNYENTSELRKSIVDYAMQFLGNKYVHGGNSLITGTDCSGFTSLIYAEFGYSLSRTPSGQLNGNGRSIAYSDIQPGDIICYGKGSKCTHVALYIGDGQIIHSANSKKGVVIYQADYDTIMGIKNVID